MIKITKETLKGAAINELQGMETNFLTGAAANTKFNVYRAGEVARGIRSFDTLRIGIKHPAAAIPAVVTLTNVSKEFMGASKFAITTKQVLNVAKAGHGLETDDYVTFNFSAAVAEQAVTATDADTFTIPFIGTGATFKKADGTAIAAPTVTSGTDGVLTVDGVTHTLATGNKCVYAVPTQLLKLKVTKVDADNFTVEIPATILPAAIYYSGVKVTEDTTNCAVEVRWFSRDNL